MSRPRVLIIAESANPDWVSVPLVGWSLANALREVADAHIVTHIRNRQAILDAGLIEGEDFTVIDSEKVARPLWNLSNMLRGGAGKGWTTGTAISIISYYYFEALVWKKFGGAIRSGQFDIVHRITPLSPTIPSLIAKKCRRANVPFILGPLNGGVPWPKGFDSARRQEKEWLSYVRNAYKLFPGYRSTLKSASALLIGSKDTLNQVPAKYHDKCIYLPENAIDPAKFSRIACPENTSVLHACFVGRLVPYKGPDMLLEAATPLLLEGRLHLDILGDGPLLQTLQDMVSKKGLESAVTLHGWVAHSEIQNIMCRSHVFAFPSIREFGGGVVLEAMALGLVPIIIDYAGPGELVNEDTGFKLPMARREMIISSLSDKLKMIADDRQCLEPMKLAARSRVHSLFTWAAKARQTRKVYDWVLDSKVGKPEFFKS
jgi:glycosyltransferase involved in cell wall biosynthesis